MSDINDIARMQYVLNNYDNVSDGGTVSAYTTNKPNGKPGEARSVVFSKAVNGVYYVVQAVPDTRAKTTYIVSAYMTKNGNNKTGGLQITDAQRAPALTSENDYANAPIDTTIPQNVSDVNMQDSTGTAQNASNTQQATPFTPLLPTQATPFTPPLPTQATQPPPFAAGQGQQVQGQGLEPYTPKEAQNFLTGVKNRVLGFGTTITDFVRSAIQTKGAGKSSMLGNYHRTL